MRDFAYDRAETVAAAIELAGRAGTDYIAGGTDLLNLMKDGVEEPGRVVDINSLPLNGVRVRPSADALRIGALARMSDVAVHPLVRRLPVLSQALLAGASPQVRNMASIGGNLLQLTRCWYFRDAAMPCNKRRPGSGCPAIEGLNRWHALLGGSEHCIAVHPSDLAVRVLSPFLGGGFGAKGPVWPHTLLTAAVARDLGRPVKLVLSRADTYTCNGHRAETHQRVRLGATRDGRLTAIEHITAQQVSRTEVAMFNSSEATRMLYACDNVRSTQLAVALDLQTGSFARSPEAAVSHGLESAMDELSYALNMDPLDLRLRNWSEINQETRARHGSNYLRECYQRGAERFGWSRRDPGPGSMRDRDGFIGWGMATAAHTTGNRPGARVTISPDGAALIQCGTQDIGTGTYTVMEQVGAEVLGMPLHHVTFQLGDTAFPQAFTSAASATVPTVGAAVVRAATAARDSVVALAVADPDGPLHGVAPDRVSTADGHLFVTGQPWRRVSYRSVLRARGEAVEATTTPRLAPLGYSTGAVFVEVHVDPTLGRVRVRRIVAVFDPGRVLNRQTARSRGIGGAVWAIGITLTEHTLVDPRMGRIITPNLSGYLVPVNADVPDIEVDFIDRPDPESPALNARGFGETPTTGVTAAIGNAVYHAIGRRIRDLPISQDKIISALS